MPKRCLVISYYFPPVGGGGVQRVTKIIKYLGKKNWQFTVFTSNPGGFTNLPLDKSHLNEIPGNTRIIRFSNSVNFNPGVFKAIKPTFFIRWINSLFFFPDTYKKWSNQVEKEVVKILADEQFDLVYITSPPYSLARLASRLTAKINTPVVLDMRDPWTTNPYKIYPSTWHLKKDKQIEEQTISNIKYGITAYKSLKDFYFTSGFITKKRNWIYIPNGFDESDFNEIKNPNHSNKVLNIAFSGTFYSHLNNPELLFNSISKLSEENKTKISFHHIGVSNINLKKVAAKYDIADKIVEWGYKSHKECLEILSGMDVLFFLLDSANPKAANTIGGKVYEYLGLKKPILALVPEHGEAANLIKHTSSGVIIDPYNQTKITETLEKWINDRPVVSQSATINEFARSTLAQKYYNFFEEIVSKK